MTRKQWINKPGHSAETTRSGRTKETHVTLIDSAGRVATAWGKDEDEAFKSAHATYSASNHRAKLSLAHVAGRHVKPVE
jgi:hypothetical protein